MHFMHEQLVDERIQRLRDEAAQIRRVQQANRTGRLSRITRGWRRFRQPAHDPTPAETRPSHTFEPTTSSA